MDSVTIKSVRGGRTLLFDERKGEYFCVTLIGDSVSATKRVWGYTDTERLPELFDSIAADWKGWKGKKEWKAIEGDLEIAATSDRLGHVRLDIEIRNHDPEDDWSVTAPIFVDAGELETIAKKIRVYFKPSKNGQGGHR